MVFLRKTFKKIGKSIKKAFAKFGKFMGKIGVLGQVAMMFILPGIGAALMKGVTGAFGAIVGQTATQATAAAAGAAASTTAVASATAAGASASAAAAAGAAASAGAVASTTASIAAGTFSGTMAAGTGLLGSTATGAAGALARGTGQLLSYVGKAAAMPGKVFTSVTQGVTKTLGEFSKTALNKISPKLATRMGVEGASSTFFAGSESAFAKGADAFAAPFSKQAAARVTERTAAKAFAKEGITYDTEQLLKGVEKVNSPAITPTSTIPKIESLTTAENTRLSEIMESPLTETQTSRLEVIKQEASDSLLSPKPTAAIDTGLPKEQYSSLGDVGKDFVQDITDIGKDAITETRETLGGKLSNLADPAKAIPALAKTAIGSYQDAQYAARANERAPEVIDLGISEDPRQFLSQDQGFFQNSAIGPYQLQNANTYTPQSSWAQQQMLMLQQQQQQGVYA